MNIGKQILELRKARNITQEELAAELGVTAAAVSKWENGYTLPDILMLCALADYFEVTTDELLGRNPNVKYAVIACSPQEFASTIEQLAKSHGFQVRQIFNCYADALDAVKADRSITHLFSSFEAPLSENEMHDSPDWLCNINIQAPTKEQVIQGFEHYFQNMTALDSLALKRPIQS